MTIRDRQATEVLEILIEHIVNCDRENYQDGEEIAIDDLRRKVT